MLGLAAIRAADYLGRRFGVRRGLPAEALAPLLAAAGLPLVVPLLDSFSFWCTAPPLAALGIGVGGILSTRRLAAIEWGETAPLFDVPRGLITAAALVLPALLLVAGWMPASGDEPHYLVTTRSLVVDGDLDLADDYRQAVYAPFHPGFLSPHYRPGLIEGSRYSMHGIGLPVVLAPAYALGGLWGPAASLLFARLLLIGFFGAFAWSLYGLIDDMASVAAARAGTLASIALAPLLFSPLFVFGEPLAMLLAVSAYRLLRRPGNGAWAAGLALAALPWIGVKYIPVAAVMLLVGLWFEAPAGRWARGLRSGVPLIASLGAHMLFTWTLYGSLSPAAIYLGAGPQAGAPALGGDWMAYLAAWPYAMATAVGFVLDQKEGLLAYGPHFLLAAAGLGVMWLRRRAEVVALALVAAAYVGPYALSQQLGGQGPPVRPLMAVLWVLSPALGIGIVLASNGRLYAALRGALLGLAACLTAAYAAQPWLLPHDYPVVASRLLQAYTPYGSGMWRWFPQWVNIDDPNWWVTGGWTLACALLGVMLWRHGAGTVAADRTPRDTVSGEVAAAVSSTAVADTAGATSWRLATATVVVACGYVLLHHALIPITDRHRPVAMDGGPVAWVAEELPEVAWAEAGGVWVAPHRRVDLVVTSATPFRSVDLLLRTLVATDVSVSVQGTVTQGRVLPGANLLARLRPGPGRSMGRAGYAYLLSMRAADGAAPASLLGGADERVLGVFLQITASDGR